MKRRVFGFLALALGIVLAACSGGTDYVGVSESSTTPAVVENYTVTFSTNGGTNAASNPDNYNVESTVTLADATKEGYAFGGWYETANFSGSAITVIAAGSTGNKTLYAKWISASVPTFEVTFETNGGSTVASQSVTEGGSASEPVAPTKTGFVFLDWYADSAFTTKYDFSAAVTTDTTIYARWWDATGFVLVDGKTIGETAGSNVFVSGRTVETAKLWASDHEVTQGEYETYCTYGGRTPNHGTGTNYPAYRVNWYDALVYCNKRSMIEGFTPCYKISGSADPASWFGVVDDGTGKLCGPSSDNADWNNATCDFTANGYRLPTEAEWEWLARGGDPASTAWEYTYSGSNTVDDVAWYDNTSPGSTHEVRGKNPNTLNLYDMSGNVWEWCWDWYGTITATTSDVGVPSGTRRVFRGGCYFEVASYCAFSRRPSYYPYDRSDSLSGFRVVRTAQ